VTRDLYLYNTASRDRSRLETPPGGTVKVYCCGPTVYNYAHIGNLRTYLFEDVLVRTLRASGRKVCHLVNITDVGHLVSDEDTGEDRMEKGSRREGKSVWEIAQFYTDAFMADLRALNITEPTRWSKATDHIPEMIGLVRQLEEKGFTYRTGDGIYFDTAKFPAYGDFAGIDADSLRAGQRVDMGDKRSATDFALWKFSPDGARRQMEWESPWGTGFPGWHIECSAMALKYLGQPVDIHCGGIDHIRVHHTNEIAQVEAATGKPFVRLWMHGEFLVIDKAKMAKSGENFITLDTVMKRGVPALAYRMFCFSAHYRSPLAFSWDGLEAAAGSLTNLKRHIADLVKTTGNETAGTNPDVPVLAPFWDALCDDLNMPRALAAVWDLLRAAHLTPRERVAAIAVADTVLGLDLLAAVPQDAQVRVEKEGVTVVVRFKGRPDPVAAEGIAEKVAKRKAARTAKDFATADRIRAELTAGNIEVKDLPDGTTEGVAP